MIRKKEFRKIKIEVENAVNEAFEYAQKNEKNLNDFILFIANGYHMDSLVKTQHNPYTIDYRGDEMNDELRLNVLLQYIRHSYNFDAENSQDSQFSLSVELMIYTHMWESKPFLKVLKKLGDLCDKEDYDWKVEVPDMGKHQFIRDIIRARFKKHNLKIHEIITNGFHTSLRNAFAHSEYVISLNEPKFQLLNYKGAEWELSEISFDDWTERFCYTFLLGYTIQQKIHGEKEKLISGNSFRVKHKDKEGRDRDTEITYDKKRNSFNFKK